MTLHKKVTQLVRHREPRPPATARRVGGDHAVASDGIRDERPLQPVKRLQPDVDDVEGPRDLDDRNRAVGRAELPVQRQREPLGVVDVGEIDPVKLQRTRLRPPLPAP